MMLALVGVPACEKQDAITTDAASLLHDARASDGTAPPTCPVKTALGTVAVTAQTAVDDVDPPNSLVYTAKLNSDARPDGLAVQLSTGFGAWKTMRIGPATFPLSGDETSMATCGACIRIRANIDANDVDEATYMPLSGTMTITSVSGNFTGSLSNVVFRQVDIDGASLATTDDPSHCMATIGSLAFDQLITVNGNM